MSLAQDLKVYQVYVAPANIFICIFFFNEEYKCFIHSLGKKKYYNTLLKEMFIQKWKFGHYLLLSWNTEIFSRKQNSFFFHIMKLHNENDNYSDNYDIYDNYIRIHTKNDQIVF